MSVGAPSVTSFRKSEMAPHGSFAPTLEKYSLAELHVRVTAGYAIV